MFPRENFSSEEYILYLHPDKISSQYSYLKEYWNMMKDSMTKKIIKKNDAMDYPFHITLSSFFTSPTPGDKLALEIKKIFSEYPEADFNKYLCPKLGTFSTWIQFYERKNVIGVALYFPCLEKILSRLSSKIPTKDPKTLHLTLASNFHNEDRDKINNLINNFCLPPEKWDDKWNVVLWKVTESRTKWEVVDLIV